MRQQGYSEKIIPQWAFGSGDEPTIARKKHAERPIRYSADDDEARRLAVLRICQRTWPRMADLLIADERGAL